MNDTQVRAIMAAILRAGDMATGDADEIADEDYYVELAGMIFHAADRVMTVEDEI
jgi:hypothetical protein